MKLAKKGQLLYNNTRIQFKTKSMAKQICTQAMSVPPGHVKQPIVSQPYFTRETKIQSNLSLRTPLYTDTSLLRIVSYVPTKF